MGDSWEELAFGVEVDWVLVVVMVDAGFVLGDIPGSSGVGEEVGECVLGLTGWLDDGMESGSRAAEWLGVFEDGVVVDVFVGAA